MSLREEPTTLLSTSASAHQTTGAQLSLAIENLGQSVIEELGFVVYSRLYGYLQYMLTQAAVQYTSSISASYRNEQQEREKERELKNEETKDAVVSDREGEKRQPQQEDKLKGKNTFHSCKSEIEAQRQKPLDHCLENTNASLQRLDELAEKVFIASQHLFLERCQRFTILEKKEDETSLVVAVADRNNNNTKLSIEKKEEKDESHPQHHCVDNNNKGRKKRGRESAAPSTTTTAMQAPSKQNDISLDDHISTDVHVNAERKKSTTCSTPTGSREEAPDAAEKRKDEHDDVAKEKEEQVNLLATCNEEEKTATCRVALELRRRWKLLLLAIVQSVWTFQQQQQQQQQSKQVSPSSIPLPKGLSTSSASLDAAGIVSNDVCERRVQSCRTSPLSPPLSSSSDFHSAKENETTTTTTAVLTGTTTTTTTNNDEPKDDITLFGYPSDLGSMLDQHGFPILEAPSAAPSKPAYHATLPTFVVSGSSVAAAVSSASVGVGVVENAATRCTINDGQRGSGSFGMVGETGGAHHQGRAQKDTFDTDPQQQQVSTSNSSTTATAGGLAAAAREFGLSYRLRFLPKYPWKTLESVWNTNTNNNSTFQTTRDLKTMDKKSKNKEDCSFGTKQEKPEHAKIHQKEDTIPSESCTASTTMRQLPSLLQQHQQHQSTITVSLTEEAKSASLSSPSFSPFFNQGDNNYNHSNTMTSASTVGGTIPNKTFECVEPARRKEMLDETIVFGHPRKATTFGLEDFAITEDIRTDYLREIVKYMDTHSDFSALPSHLHSVAFSVCCQKSEKLFEYYFEHHEDPSLFCPSFYCGSNNYSSNSELGDQCRRPQDSGSKTTAMTTSASSPTHQHRRQERKSHSPPEPVGKYALPFPFASAAAGTTSRDVAKDAMKKGLAFPLVSIEEQKQIKRELLASSSSSFGGDDKIKLDAKGRMEELPSANSKKEEQGKEALPRRENNPTIVPVCVLSNEKNKKRSMSSPFLAERDEHWNTLRLNAEKELRKREKWWPSCVESVENISMLCHYAAWDDEADLSVSVLLDLFNKHVAQENKEKPYTGFSPFFGLRELTTGSGVPCMVPNIFAGNSKNKNGDNGMTSKHKLATPSTSSTACSPSSAPTPFSPSFPFSEGSDKVILDMKRLLHPDAFAVFHELILPILQGRSLLATTTSSSNLRSSPNTSLLERIERELHSVLTYLNQQEEEEEEERNDIKTSNEKEQEKKENDEDEADLFEAAALYFPSLWPTVTTTTTHATHLSRIDVGACDITCEDTGTVAAAKITTEIGPAVEQRESFSQGTSSHNRVAQKKQKAKKSGEEHSSPSSPSATLRLSKMTRSDDCETRRREEERTERKDDDTHVTINKNEDGRTGAQEEKQKFPTSITTTTNNNKAFSIESQEEESIHHVTSSSSYSLHQHQHQVYLLTASLCQTIEAVLLLASLVETCHRYSVSLIEDMVVADLKNLGEEGAVPLSAHMSDSATTRTSSGRSQQQQHSKGKEEKEKTDGRRTAQEKIDSKSTKEEETTTVGLTKKNETARQEASEDKILSTLSTPCRETRFACAASFSSTTTHHAKKNCTMYWRDPCFLKAFLLLKCPLAREDTFSARIVALPICVALADGLLLSLLPTTTTTISTTTTTTAADTSTPSSVLLSSMESPLTGNGDLCGRLALALQVAFERRAKDFFTSSSSSSRKETEKERGLRMSMAMMDPWPWMVARRDALRNILEALVSLQETGPRSNKTDNTKNNAAVKGEEKTETRMARSASPSSHQSASRNTQKNKEEEEGKTKKKTTIFDMALRCWFTDVIAASVEDVSPLPGRVSCAGSVTFASLPFVVPQERPVTFPYFIG